jgi:hypothetical protein
LVDRDREGFISRCQASVGQLVGGDLAGQLGQHPDPFEAFRDEADGDLDDLAEHHRRPVRVVLGGVLGEVGGGAAVFFLAVRAAQQDHAG